MTEDERDAEIEKVSALFVALPGVVGAPLLTGPDYWVEVARHLVETGVRLCADPIKHYVAGDSLAKSKAAGEWVYSVDDVPETFEQRAQRMAKEQREKYLAALAAKRAAGELPPEGATRQQRQAWRVQRAAAAESAAMDQTIAERAAAGTLDGSPVEKVARARKAAPRKSTRRKKKS
ncbi:phage gene 29 protein family protein [Gordonia sp. DT219]|uniref:phage gene 29 protein family protein n=1 Tax=Gordonia sp. DT219 TaxID=3416658 RepID=UPI003CE89767